MFESAGCVASDSGWQLYTCAFTTRLGKCNWRDQRAVQCGVIQQ